MSRTRSTAVVVVAALALASRASAQITSNATCLSQFQGLYNSKGQSPCLVAANLGGACNGGQFDVSALSAGHFYQGPAGDQVNDCQCSTVYYSLIGACSTCQNATIVSWSSWIQNCNTVSVDNFPESIPIDTAVPGWAYENVTIQNTFDVTSALQDTSHESTATNTPASTLSGHATGTADAANSGPTTSSSPPGGSSNTGAIAGGVVGGVVGVALLALLTFFLCRRRNKSGSSAKKTGGGVAAMGTGQGSPLMSEKEFNGGMYSPGPPPQPYTPGAYEQPRLYDPNDPSTFPSSPPPQSLGTQLTGQTLSTNYSQTQHSDTPFGPSPQTQFTGSSGPQGTYRGVAEV